MHPMLMMNNPMVQMMQMCSMYEQRAPQQYGPMFGLPEGNYIADNRMCGDYGFHRSQPWYPPAEANHAVSQPQLRTEQWVQDSAGQSCDVPADQQFGEAVEPHYHKKHRQHRTRRPPQILDQPEYDFDNGQPGDKDAPKRHISSVMVPREVPANFISKIGINCRIDPDKILSGEETRTTIYWTSIPNKYDRTSLHKVLSDLYPNKIDYLYIVMDPANGCNVGFAFINFRRPIDVLTFYTDFHRKGWAQLQSQKICEVGYGCNQGIEELKAVHGRQRKPRSHEHLPLFLDETTGELAPLQCHWKRAPRGGHRAAGEEIQDMG